jgi:hypothetical protein
MATPPTFVAEYESAWNSNTSPKTLSVTFNTGDVLVAMGIGADQGDTLGAPSDVTGVTWGATVATVSVASRCYMEAWATVATGSGSGVSISLSETGGSSDFWGWSILRFSGSDGVGNNNSSNGSGNAPSVAVTTATDNAAIVCFAGDWQAGVNTGRTWRTINSITPTSGNGLETTAFRDASNYTTYGAYWTDCGAAGSKTTGLTAPNMDWSCISIEVKSSAGAAATSPPGRDRKSGLNYGALLQL